MNRIIRKNLGETTRMKIKVQPQVDKKIKIGLNTENHTHLEGVKAGQSSMEFKGSVVSGQRLQAFIFNLKDRCLFFHYGTRNAAYSMGSARAGIVRFALPIFLFSLFACSSKPTYKPEVGGEGARASSRGGVLYSIPPENPVMKMRIASAVLPGKKKVQVRLLFVRKGAPAGEYLDPREQSLVLPDSNDEIHPSRVHADSAYKPLVRLDGAKKQAVELEFPLPAGGRHEYPYIQLKWKIHYRQGGQDKNMSELERFDFIRKAEPKQGPGQQAEWEDVDFPYMDYGNPLPPEWMNPGFLWW
jgi:hypothetical protein